VNLALTNVETVTSAGGVSTVNLANAANGLDIDLGLGFQTLFLGNSDNTVTVRNAETITSAGIHNDNVTVYLDASITNQSINLGFGTDTLTLAGPNGNFSISVGGSDLTVFGATDTGDEHINLLNTQAGTTFDLGNGAFDSLALFGQNGFFNLVNVKNVEFVTGSAFSDTIDILNTVGTTTVTGGGGADVFTASAGDDHFRFTSLTDSSTVNGSRDSITGFDAAHDQFLFEGMSGSIQSAIQYIGTGAFNGIAGSAQARLEISTPTDAVVQIDGNGDALIDMEIALHNWSGILQNGNFILL